MPPKKHSRGVKGYDTQGTDVGEKPHGKREQVLKPGSRVAVVGGGCAGVYVVKTLAELGLKPVLFEQSHVGLGGVWRKQGYGGVAYDVLRTNSSEVTTAAPDYPFPFKPSSPFPHYTEIITYITEYAARYNLNQHIRFGTKVVDVSPVDTTDRDTKWKVTLQATPKDHDVYGVIQARFSEPAYTEEFDAVFTTAGQYGGGPFVPEVKGRDVFQGTVLHSNVYKNNDVAAGKNVVVVGIGNSALDIAFDCGACAKNVFISARHGAAILCVEDLKGNPFDLWLLTRGTDSTASIEPSFLHKSPIHQAFLKAGMPPPNTDSSKVGTGMIKDQKTCLRHLESGKIKLGTGVKHLTKDTVVLQDGREIPCDVLVFCTGYDLEGTLSFMDKGVMRDVSNHTPSGKYYVNLYKMCMHPRYRTLSLCGLATTNANEALVGEMQARWQASVLLGKANQPTKEDIYKYIAERNAMIQSVDPYFPRFIRYVAYMDSFAEELGCLPDIKMDPKWKKQSVLLPPKPPTDPEDLYNFNLHFGPVVGLHWRLNGPNAWKEADKAKEYVNKRLIPGLHLPRPSTPFSWAPPAAPARL
eukprot:TRINITY_DN1647_c1_g1_i1.p1 TRINITY_DN1647_c1_g1~~TRINITY_DN1647_c1_g1_i1.p1  ORF type:complete len:595 (+),score=184.67 TRINITY_DN1647_c1_g1_i1:43-1785(+)